MVYACRIYGHPIYNLYTVNWACFIDRVPQYEDMTLNTDDNDELNWQTLSSSDTTGDL